MMQAMSTESWSPASPTEKRSVLSGSLTDDGLPHLTTHDSSRSNGTTGTAADEGVSDEARSDAASTVDSATPTSAPTGARERAGTWLDQVSTPWARNVPVEEVLLEQEVAAFHKLVKLTPVEERLRKVTLRQNLQEVLRSAWPLATAKLFGSITFGLSIFTSNVDVVVDEADFSVTPLADVAALLTDAGYMIRSIDASELGGLAVLRAQARGVCLDIHVFRESRTEMRRPVKLLKERLARFPAAAACINTLRWVLEQSKMLAPAPGGISPYALTIMVLGYCASIADDTKALSNAGTLLRNVLHFYGSQFDYAGLTMTVDGPVSRIHAERAGVSVVDPMSDGNLAESVPRPLVLKALLQYSALALAKWDGRIGESVNWREYRGKTPLSSVIAHKQLWERAKELEEQHCTIMDGAEWGHGSSPTTPATADLPDAQLCGSLFPRRE